MTASGNAAEGIPRGHIRGGRDPLAGGTRTEMQHYPAHVTCSRRTSSSRDQPQVACLVVRSDDLRELEIGLMGDFVGMRERSRLMCLDAMST